MPQTLKVNRPSGMTDKEHDKLMAFIEIGQVDGILLADTLFKLCEDDDTRQKLINAIPLRKPQNPHVGTCTLPDPPPTRMSIAQIISAEDVTNNNVDSVRTPKRACSPSQDDNSAQKLVKKPKPEAQGAKCLNCNADFVPEENNESSCLFHPGESELNEEDMDESHDHYRHSDNWGMRLQDGEAFVWNCCDESLEEYLEGYDPCKSGKHRVSGKRLEYVIWRGMKDSKVG